MPQRRTGIDWSAWNQAQLRESLISREGSATEDGDLSVTDRRCEKYTLRNGTLAAFAHSVTRSHAVTNFSCVAQAQDPSAHSL